MKKSFIISLFFLLVALLMTSCSNKNKDEVKAKSRISLSETCTTQEALSMLILQVDGDEDVLCRVLNCSKSTFDRLHSGKTFPTENADKEIRNLLKYSYEKGTDAIYKLDPTDRWFDYIKRLIDSCPIWLYIIGLIILGAVLGATLQDVGLYITLAIPFVILIFRFCIYYICTLIWTKPELIDKFVNSLDPIWETL